MRYITGGILLITLFSFCHPNRSVYKLNKIYGDLCDIYSSLSLKKDSLVIIERMNPGQRAKKAKFFYRASYKSGDTLLQRKNMEIDQSVAKQKRKELIESSFYIDTIARYKFEYDKIPDTLMKVFNNEEKIVSFKEQSMFWIYLTRNEKNGVWRLYTSRKGGEESAFMELTINPETPDFFLFDIIGDDTPEIFIIRKSYLMNRYLQDIDVYGMLGYTTNKKAF